MRIYSILICEATERLCFYGVRAVLVLFLLSLGYSNTQAISLNAYWISFSYFTPLLGAMLSDASWGRFTAILVFSLGYVLGMATLTLGAQLASPAAVLAGLLLVGLGAGGIKPCVGPFGADQLMPGSPAATSYWLIFYFCINCGSLLSYFFVPMLRAQFGFSAAIALPAASMAASLLLFLAPAAHYTRVPPQGSALLGVGRAVAAALRSAGSSSSSSSGRGSASASSASASSAASGSDTSSSASEHMPLVGSARAAAGGAAAHPPSPGSTWLDAALGAPGVTAADVAAASAMARLLPFFALLPFFWAVYDSHASISLLQAKRMGLCFGARGSSACMQADQVAVLNPILVVTLIPLITARALPALQALPEAHWAHPTPLRRMCLGMALATLSFALTGVVQQALEAGAALHVAVQVPQYVLLALAEVGVSATGLEFFFSQAPASAKSLVLALFLCTTALGDLLTGVLYSAGGGLGEAALIWVLTALCGAAAVGFTVMARRYVAVQAEGVVEAEAEEARAG